MVLEVRSKPFRWPHSLTADLLSRYRVICLSVSRNCRAYLGKHKRKRWDGPTEAVWTSGRGTGGRKRRTKGFVDVPDGVGFVIFEEPR